MALGANKKDYHIILDISIKEKIDEIAKEEDRSLSNLINYILKQYIEDREGEK